jgi:hypothetical protein
MVVLLLPEQSRFKRTYSEIAPRVALETLVRLAAVRAGVDIEVLPRTTVRSRLKLPRSGDLASHVPTKVPVAVGRYWTAGRDIASLAAPSRRPLTVRRRRRGRVAVERPCLLAVLIGWL